jgi:hypothetical protein
MFGTDLAHDPEGVAIGAAEELAEGLGSDLVWVGDHRLPCWGDERRLAGWIVRILDHPDNEAEHQRVAAEVWEMASAYPAPGTV